MDDDGFDRPSTIGYRLSAIDSLRRDQEVTPPVLLPAGLVLLVAERLFLPFADRLDAVRCDAEAGEILRHSFGAAIAEREVVFGTAARVAMPFDRHLGARPSLHPLGVFLQRLRGVAADLAGIEIEECIRQRLLGVQLVE